MALISADERELLLPLAEGVHETPPWQTFVARLAGRTGADMAAMLVPAADRESAPLLEVHGGPRGGRAFDLARLVQAGLAPLAELRPGRVYALAEFVDPLDGARRKTQLGVLIETGLRDARMVRTPARDGRAAVIAILSARREFRGADSALLGALVPHVGAALHAFAALCTLEARLARADGALGRLGVGTVAFDREARVLDADAAAAELLGGAALPGRRLALAPEQARALDLACADFARDPGAPPRLVRLDAAAGIDMLLRPPLPQPALAPPVAAVGEVRRSPLAQTGDAARVLAAIYGLSANEAALAEALAHGETILEAGARLRLTGETARNYSKRIYAKTGARGQADLVRLVLTGVAALA